MDLLASKDLSDSLAMPIFRYLLAFSNPQIFRLHRGGNPEHFDIPFQLSLTLLEENHEGRQFAKNNSDLKQKNIIFLHQVIGLYGLPTGWDSHQLFSVATSLFTLIANGREDIDSNYLFLLHNICKHSPYIKTSLQKHTLAKNVYRRLVGALSTPFNNDILIGTLVLLATLLLDQESGKKIFKESNVNYIAELVLTMVIEGNAESPLLRNGLCDLLQMMLLDERCATYLI
eukprot:Ihof_evm1s396 gene=Ihof_evmTU1s396